MAFVMKTEGMTEISEMLTQMAERAQGAAAQGLYDGAGVMADAIAAGAKSIKTEPFHYAAVPGITTRMPSPEEKEIVLNAAAGIAKFHKSGTEVDTSVGYQNSGYALLKGKVVPVPKIVNAINSGTSFMQKQPFVRKAARQATPKAMAAIKSKIEEVFDEMNK
jgi:glutamate synthase domain-containing protein 1